MEVVVVVVAVVVVVVVAAVTFMKRRQNAELQSTEKEYIVLPVVPICIPFYALGAAAARETGGSFSNHGLFSCGTSDLLQILTINNIQVISIKGI